MISKRRVSELLVCVFLAVPLCAQDEHKENHQMAEKMPGMKMVNMNAAGMFLMNLSSGTASNPGPVTRGTAPVARRSRVGACTIGIGSQGA